MSFFIADNINKEEQIIQQYLTKGDANRLLFIQLGEQQAPKQKQPISPEKIKKLAHLSNQLKEVLQKSNFFIAVENGKKSLQQSLNNKLYTSRYLISPELSSDLFSIASLDAQFKLLQQRMQMILSPVEQKIIAQSPLNIWFKYLQSINKTQLNRSSGVWFNNKQQAILLLKTRAAGFDIPQQQANIDFILEQINKIIPANIPSNLSGAAIIALKNSQAIRYQITIISTIASLVLAAFLFSLFRSIKIVLLISMPLFFAVLVGMSTVNLFYGYIHGITLAFGITIIGIAVDYPLHYFSHLLGNSALNNHNNISLRAQNKQSIMQIWPKLKLGLLTTLIGFSAITFSSFSGLNQLGIFAISGLISAVLITRYVLPLFVYKSLNYKRLKNNKNQQLQLMQKWIKPFNYQFSCTIRYLILFFMLLAILYISTHKNLWENDIASLSPVSKELKQQDFALRKSLNLPELRYLLLISENTQQQILEKSEQLKPYLEQMINNETISYYDSASRYIPSIKLQLQRQKYLPSKKLLYKNLSHALQDSPFSITAFSPFIRAINNNKTQQPLTPENLGDSLLSTKIQGLLFATNKKPAQELNNSWTGLILLSGVNAEKLTLAVQRLHTKNPHFKELKLIDLKQKTNTIIKSHRIEASKWFFIGSFFIVLFLLFYTKKIAALPALFLPFSGAIIFTITIILLLGYSLSIFHLVTLLLVVGLGIDYSVFIYSFNNLAIEENIQSKQQQLNKTTINTFSVLVCSISSFIMFFSLSLSSVPVLEAIGLTTASGLSLAFFLTLVFSRACKQSCKH
ncbi:MAG: MMPL family transporter [Pseudomonadota bacterium]